MQWLDKKKKWKKKGYYLGQLGNFNMNCILGNSTVSIISAINSQMFQEKVEKRENICGKCLWKSRWKTYACSWSFLVLFLYIWNFP